MTQRARALFERLGELVAIAANGIATA